MAVTCKRALPISRMQTQILNLASGRRCSTGARCRRNWSSRRAAARCLQPRSLAEEATQLRGVLDQLRGLELDDAAARAVNHELEDTSAVPPVIFSCEQEGRRRMRVVVCVRLYDVVLAVARGQQGLVDKRERFPRTLRGVDLATSCARPRSTPLSLSMNV